MFINGLETYIEREKENPDACVLIHGIYSYLIFTRYEIMQQTDIRCATSVGRKGYSNNNKN
jgi:hypothetical protein